MNRFYELSDSTCIDLFQVCLVSHEFEGPGESPDEAAHTIPTEPVYSFDIILKSGYAYVLEHEDVREIRKERKRLIAAWKKFLREDMP